MWEEGYRNAERGLHTIKQWFDRNRLTVNICKTKHMAVSLRATRDPVGLELKMHNGQCGACQCHSTERISTFKYLGVMFDDRLAWATHVSYINSKL
ncbi:hypothetical protein J6590_008091 [Homalodisca vitripennis]|nr:hypothetical protein J6590_008091 [Homalodisca vitripennis]